MKRSLSTMMLSLAGALVFLQPGCTPKDTQPTSSSLPTPEATADTAAIESELLRIENDWPRVMKARDGAAVRRVDADDAHLLSWDGTLFTREEDAKFIESGAIVPESMQMTDLKVKVLDKDAAVVTGMITIKGAKSPDKNVDINGQYRFVDTFARRDGQWKLVASASVKLPPTTLATPSPSPKASPAAAVSPAVKASPAARPPVVRPSPVKVAPVATPVRTPTP